MEPYYRDDLVTIYHGNSLAVMAEFDTGAFAGCVTDPPYSSGGAFRSDRTNTNPAGKYLESASANARLPDFAGDNRDQRGFLAWCSIWMAEVLRVSEDGAPFLAFTDWRQLPTMTDAVQAGGWNWQGLFVWDKVNGRPQKNRPRQSLEYVVYGVSGLVRTDEFACIPAIIRATVPPTAERVHVTEKPVDVIQHLLPLVRPGGVVFDPFMGSGTTLVAAKNLGHRAAGVEIEERYCEIAAQRCLQETLALR